MFENVYLKTEARTLKHLLGQALAVRLQKLHSLEGLAELVRRCRECFEEKKTERCRVLAQVSRFLQGIPH